MEFVDSSFSLDVSADFGDDAIKSCTRTIVVDDISDLLPIVLGTNAVEKDISLYIRHDDKNAGNSSDEEETENLDVATQDKEEVVAEDDFEQTEENGYAMLVDYNEEVEVEFGDFIEGPSVNALGACLSAEDEVVGAQLADMSETKTEYSSAKPTPRIRPLTAGI
jgi:hypothetical protein